MKAILFSLAAITCVPVIAAPVYKCIDEAGGVTYSQLGCGDPDHVATLVNPKNPPPGGDTPAVMAVARELEPEPQVVESGPSQQQLADLAAREQAVAAAESRNEREREALQKLAQTTYYSDPGAGRRRIYVNDRQTYVPPPSPPATPVKPRVSNGYRLKGQYE
ncbi:DUF4124 domain-containing protein [Pseudomonas sp. LRF_L74]|uniref:DUF4124 domain-containing protein n=1 Tax=Pseudomonas sp. LRF_L74 TaxID=3369422 RepID=UPI003F5E835E